MGRNLAKKTHPLNTYDENIFALSSQICYYTHNYIYKKRKEHYKNEYDKLAQTTWKKR